MNIKTTQIANSPIKSGKKAAKAKADVPQADVKEAAVAPQKDYVSIEVSKDSVKNAVVKGALASGGALAGVGLGVITGGALAQLTGTPMLAAAGGVLGALGGAGTAFAVSGKENKKETLTTVALGWGGAAAGAVAGQWGIGGVLGALGEAAGSTVLTSTAPLIGTAAGSAVAAAIALSGQSDEVATTVQKGGAIAALATLGLGLGEAGRALAVYNNMPGHAAAFAPILGAATGALIGHSATTNDPASLHAKLSSPVGFGTLGYAFGNVAAAFTQSVGGSEAYTYALPLAGMLVGGSLGLGGVEAKLESKTTPFAVATTGLTFGTVAGDLGGHVLNMVTGQSIHTTIGPVIGAVAGGLAGLEAAEFDTKGAANIAGGAVGGWAVGGLAGSALSYLTGNSIYAEVGSVLGAVNGGALVAEATGKINTMGAGITVMGATAGMGVGAALGTAIQTVTGQSIWGTVLPVLGATAGGLSGLAHTLTKDDGAEKKSA